MVGRSENGMPRRRFLGMLAGLGAGIALGGLPGVGAGGGVARDRLVFREIPSTGERIPASGLGSYRTFNIDPADGQAMDRMGRVLRVFAEGGGRVVDSSPMYGRAERVLGLLAEREGLDEQLWFATKVWTRGREAGIRQMEESVDLLEARPLDLMQVHNLVDLETHLETLQQWKADGRFRYIGITHYQSGMHAELERLIRHHTLDFVQFNYSVIARNAEERLLPACADAGVATLINEPFGQGRFFPRVADKPLPDWAEELDCHSWAQLALKYLIAHPAVTAVIPATSNPEHAADNIAAGREPLPDADLRRRIVEAVEG